MPRLSCWFIRTALLYLILGFTFGALMLANKGLAIAPALWHLLPAHIEFLLLGWTLQLAMGVAFWILPRFRSSRGSVRAAWTAYWLLNGGVLLVGLSALVGGAPTLTLLGRMFEVGAMVAFALNAWPRVKPIGA